MHFFCEKDGSDHLFRAQQNHSSSSSGQYEANVKAIYCEVVAINLKEALCLVVANADALQL